MIDKFVPDMEAAMAGIADGATVMIAGFGDIGMPRALLDGLVAGKASDLTLVVNSGGRDGSAIVRLLEQGRVRRMITSFVRAASLAGKLVEAGKLELEIVPQGTLAERIRAAGAGIPAFYTPTGAGTLIAEGRETRELAGRPCLLEHAIAADVALVEAWQADRWGNLTFRSTGRSFNPIMATAAKLTIVQTQHVVELGELDPEMIVTPGIFVNRVLHVPYGEPVLAPPVVSSTAAAS